MNERSCSVAMRDVATVTVEGVSNFFLGNQLGEWQLKAVGRGSSGKCPMVIIICEFLSHTSCNTLFSQLVTMSFFMTVTLSFDFMTSFLIIDTFLPALMLIAQAVFLLECGHKETDTHKVTDATGHSTCDSTPIA